MMALLGRALLAVGMMACVAAIDNVSDAEPLRMGCSLDWFIPVVNIINNMKQEHNDGRKGREKGKVRRAGK